MLSGLNHILKKLLLILFSFELFKILLAQQDQIQTKKQQQSLDPEGYYVLPEPINLEKIISALHGVKN